MILDEPFSGLDPVSAESLREAVLDLRRNGTTVILSTHDMRTAETLCDSILMIFRGRKVLDGTLAEIQDQYGNDTIRVSAAGGMGAMKGCRVSKAYATWDRRRSCALRAGTMRRRRLRALIERTRVESFTIARPSLDDIFVRIAGPEGATAQHA